MQKNAQILTIQLNEFSQTEHTQVPNIPPQKEHHQAQRSPLTSTSTLRVTHTLTFISMD